MPAAVSGAFANPRQFFNLSRVERLCEEKKLEATIYEYIYIDLLVLLVSLALLRFGFWHVLSCGVKTRCLSQLSLTSLKMHQH